MKVLDCTLRDGGYYNNWDFDPKVVNAYLKAIAQSSVDIVELGLRSFPRKGFHGAFTYVTESFLETLSLPDGPIYGVMVDAKTILESGMTVEYAVDALFIESSGSKIDLVRIAAHFHEVEASQEIVYLLVSKGYRVGFNLMQAGGKPSKIIAEKAKQITTWGSIEVLYFADSLGNMDSKEVGRIISAIRIEWTGEIGIHTHDNMGLAISNTLSAKDFGATWLDSTITGMGRGAGNAQTERLIALLEQEGDYNPQPIFELVIKTFEPLQKQYNWGSNLLYFLGAQKNIHPTYIQTMLSDTHYGPDEIVGAINFLGSYENNNFFDQNIFNIALNLNSETKPHSGKTDIINKFQNQNVLIVGAGNSVKIHLTGIEQLIKKHMPIVINLNLSPHLTESLINYYCVSHNIKFLSEKSDYKTLNKPFIYPSHRFSEEELELLNENLEHVDYGLNIEPSQISATNQSASIPYNITAAYALCACASGNVKKIYLAGFDGYDANDSRQHEMLRLFQLFQENFAIEIISLTPTNYNISKSSVYAPFNEL